MPIPLSSLDCPIQPPWHLLRRSLTDAEAGEPAFNAPTGSVGGSDDRQSGLVAVVVPAGPLSVAPPQVRLAQEAASAAEAAHAAAAALEELQAPE